MNQRFYADMDDDDLIKYTIENHYGKNINKVPYSLMGNIRKRRLINVLVEEGILKRKGKVNGFYKEMDNEDLVKYIIENHYGENLGKITSALMKNIKERGLVNFLVEEKILKRKGKPSGFYKNMDDDDLVKYVIKNHYGETTTKIESALMAKIRERKLTNLLVKENIIRKKIASRGIYLDMNNEELIKYVTDNHYGKTITQLGKKSSGLEKEIRKRGMLKSLIEKNILFEKAKPNGFYKGMDDDDLVKYIIENYSGKNISYIWNNSNSLAKVIRERNLIETLQEEGIIKKRKVRSKIEEEERNTFQTTLPEEFRPKKTKTKAARKRKKSEKKLCEITQTNFDKGNFFEQYVGLVLKYFDPEEQVVPQFCLNVGLDWNGEGILGTRVDFKVGDDVYEIKVGSPNSAGNIRESIEKQTKHLRKNQTHNTITLDDYVLEDDLKEKTSQISFLELIEGDKRLTSLARAMKNNEISPSEYPEMTNYAYTMLARANDEPENSDAIIEEAITKLDDGSYKDEAAILRWNPLEAWFEWEGKLYTTQIDISRFVKEESYDENAKIYNENEVRQKSYQRRVEDFNKFKAFMDQQVKGVPIGWYDEDKNLIEINDPEDSQLYQLSESKHLRMQVKEYVEEGILSVEKINLMKHKNKKRKRITAPKAN